MSTDFRALCAELADALDAWQLGGGPPEDTADADLIARARTALAQPGPMERPIWTEGVCGDGAAILKDGVMQPIESVIAALNAAELAQPEPEGTADEAWQEFIELRARIEALEAAQLEQAESHRFCIDAIVRRVEALEATQHAIRSGPESPLVERVADAIAGQATSAGIVNDRPARAAIREVAKWLRDRYPKSPEAGAMAFNLCQEANRG